LHKCFIFHNMENRTFAQFDLFLSQHVVYDFFSRHCNIRAMLLSSSNLDSSSSSSSYEAHDFNLSPKKEVSSQLWSFFFQNLISYNTRLIIQCESCTLFFKLNLSLVAINHDQQSYLLLFLNFNFFLHE